MNEIKDELCRAFHESYECRLIQDNDEQLLKSFTVRKGGGFLANYLWQDSKKGINSFALLDNKSNNSRVYLVIDKTTNELAGYFALKAGYIAWKPTRRIFRKEFDSLPGVELANFAVNESYIKNHEDRKGLGSAIFHYLVIPTAQKAQETIGIRFIYIFALPYADLIKRYKETYGFDRLNKKQENSMHKLIRPRYDCGCIFMYQIL